MVLSNQDGDTLNYFLGIWDDKLVESADNIKQKMMDEITSHPLGQTILRKLVFCVSDLGPNQKKACELFRDEINAARDAEGTIKLVHIACSMHTAANLERRSV